MDFDKYADLKSPLHSWETRLKLVAILLIIFSAAAVHRPVGLAVLLLLAAGAAAAARFPPVFIRQVLRFPLLFLLIMTPILLLTAGGRSLFTLGPLHLYRDGLLLVIVITVKSVSIVLLLAVLFGSCRLNRIMRAMEKLRVPAILIMLINFTYRYIFLYIDDLRTILTAARLRGAARGRLPVKIRTTSAVLVSLLVRSFEQSQRVFDAMRLRGFRDRFYILVEEKITGRDIGKSLLAAVAVAVLILTGIV